MVLQETFTLANGVAIPKLGLGTWFISNDTVAQAVKDAAKIGYRHIDTAQAYQNESGVGEGIKASGVSRKDMFITTKVAAELKSYRDAAASIETSLKRLNLDYIDLMIIHSPRPWAEFRSNKSYQEGNREAWHALEEAYKAGKLRSIGLSNFEQEDIDDIINSCSITPMVNQILVHISNTPEALIQYCKDKQIVVEAYSPIGHGELLKNQEVAALAKKYNVSIPRLAIRYCLQLGLVALPKTANPDHMKTNADVDFIITEDDMTHLANVEQIDDYGEASRFPIYQKK
jgi:diketogulonate reductase-like aldo/keto reductase